jgi:uncharacterized protein
MQIPLNRAQRHQTQTPVLSLSEARRIAAKAQGFDRPRPKTRVKARDMRRVVQQLGLVQIDYINVLVPAQYQVLFSRLGPYDRRMFDDLVYKRREFTEQWAHEASIIPVETWPLLRERMKTRRFRPYPVESILEQYPAYLGVVLEYVRERGPVGAEDLPLHEHGPSRIPGAWHGSVARATVEAHFARGRIAIAARRSDFSRLYDLAERIVPAEHHSRSVEAADAERDLLRIAAKAQGIATAPDLADYFRSNIRESRMRIAELVEEGELTSVQVEGWREPAYLHKDAKAPKRIDANTLLSPFDPLIWFRPRVARLFGFDYRAEIWVPEPKRKWGYYVMPFLLSDQLVARVDLKADRPSRSLLVLAAYIEPHAKPGKVAPALTTELGNFAAWLNLDSIVVAKKGNFASQLRAAVRKQN